MITYQSGLKYCVTQTTPFWNTGVNEHCARYLHQTPIIELCNMNLSMVQLFLEAHEWFPLMEANIWYFPSCIPTFGTLLMSVFHSLWNEWDIIYFDRFLCCLGLDFHQECDGHYCKFINVSLITPLLTFIRYW